MKTGNHLLWHGVRSMLLVLLPLLSLPLWAQTDYSGTYYIASRNNYNSASTATNYYLCPTEEWAFYVSDGIVTGNDNGQPFLTTYQCRNGSYDATKAVWSIEKDPNSNYYYIIQASTGKYLLANGAICTNPDRARIHLETIADPSDLDTKALFDIYLYSDDYLHIRPIGITDGTSSAHTNHDNHKWLTVNQGNKQDLAGTNARTDGPSGFPNTGGIICLYTENDANAGFYLESAITIDPPVITNNYTASNTFTITAATGATIYYTTDGTTPTTSSPNKGSSPINITQTGSMTVVKAIAKHPDDAFPTAVISYALPACDRPVITVGNSNNVTITCTTPNADIYYTDDNTAPTTSSTAYSGSFPLGGATYIRAVAVSAGYQQSIEAVYAPPLTVHSSSEIVDMSRSYILADDFTSTAAIGTALAPFTGTIDGQMHILSGLDHPLVAYANGAVIKNVLVDSVTISGGSNAGAICNEAAGNCRIYNCGVLATGSTVEKDEEGYDEITTCSSTISGSGYVGGIVGLLDGSSRVVNCFSYANITGGTHRGGIVGKNNVDYDDANFKTMVMNCMFYGEITTTGSPTQIAPIYGGEMITNDGDANGVNSFNYFRIEAGYITNTAIAKTYNCALGAETRFLQRFEFYRHLLNSNRELAAWWATGDVENKEEMMKWVLEPSQIGTATPYPILKAPGKYPSVVNYTPSETAYDSTEANRNKGQKLTAMGTDGKLSVTIRLGTNTGSTPFSQPSGAAFKAGEDGVFDLTITDKDPAHFNFNYGKVQLPYYNDYCVGNYTENRVVTGWKIVSITGGTADGYSTGDDVTYIDGILTATPYNFADRHCTNKDLYDDASAGSDRVFNQGAYWDVPEGVTAITIEPYWGKAVYLADAYWDVTYQNSGDDAMVTAAPVTTIGQHYVNRTSTFNGQTVYTSLGGTDNAISSTALYSEGYGTDHTVYDYAVVLVGNYHHTAAIEADNKKPYTVTSVDLDGDNEPDYSFILRFNSRTLFHPVRFDFLNLIGLGMAQKTTGGTGSYNLGIMQPKYWFEVTNTALFRVTQFEYSPAGRAKKPIILQGGVIEQWVTQQQDAGDAVEYFHVGGNVWFKEFHRGSHQDNADKSTPHPPLSVTGGDYDKFYLTGLYQSQAKIYDDNAECYINGGRFGEVAGAGMEGIGTSNDKGNITWVIDNADIESFYGGGINAAKPVHGNIHTIISNSRVDIFCGGPKFGDMESNRTVKTVATGCTFGTYFGAGYGGNAYTRHAPTNQTSKMNINWNNWVRGQYKQIYNGTYKGVSTQIDYQFIPMSGNLNNVCRLFVDFISFSLAQCNNVTSTLDSCTVKRNFYGGGSLGKVNGDVSSTLDGCIVKGNVFGAGYSASLPTVEVDSIGFRVEPYYYEDLGTYRTAEKGATTTYTWQHGNAISIDKENHILYTTADLTTLGTVTGTATLTLNGTTVGTLEAGVLAEGTGNVYGGGEESNVSTNTSVTITGTSLVYGSVFGAGKGKDDDYDMARVGGDASVTMTSGQVGHSVYGGGEMATVGVYTTARNAADDGDTITGRTSGGATTVTISGGTIGPADLDPVDIDGNGNVFGGGLGKAGHAYSSFAYVNSTAVTLGGSATVRGSVFGGGENGHVLHDAAVTIGGGTVGVRIPHRYRNISTDAGSSNPVYAGNVYGGGRGVDHTAVGDHLSQTAGRVYGNTSVSVTGGQVHHSVYGGGSLASVGTYTLTPDATIYGGYIHTFTANTGDATVSVSGGRIGPTWDELLYDEAGNRLVDANGDPLDDGSYTPGHAADTIAQNYECLGENEGMVYGSGRGVNHDPNSDNEDDRLFVEMAFTNNTTVTISGGEVIGSVFGGGENGHVKGNTQVNIQGGTIGGIPLHHNGFDLPGHTSGHGHIDDANEGDDELDFNNTGIGRSVFRGNVYGGGRGIDHTSGNPSSAPAHIFSVSAGRVYGNTEINITGGRVLHNVFGGGSIASVGTYHYPDNDFYANPEVALSGTGKTTVTISGGQVGVMGENEGYVYGGGRGIAGTSEAQVGHLAFVNETEVNIESDEVNSRHADIRASVFGGGMNGHVLTNTLVTVSGGVIGGKTAANYGSGADSYDPTRFPTLPPSADTTIHGTAYYSGIHSGDTNTNSDGTGPATVFLGNVYGGGRGVDTVTGANLSHTAGRVYGNTEVNITGGVIYHSVFGGGSIASVGLYELYTPADTVADHGTEELLASCYRLVADQPKVLDTTDITPAEGRHRNSYRGVATVTISGGRIGTNGRNNGRVFGSSRGMAGTSYRGLGYVNIAHVTIGGTAEVRGSVFGSGENGHVLDSTLVTINGGHIGNGKRTGGDAWLNHYIGNVYGGGRGLDREVGGGGTVSPFAGRVYRSSNVVITAGQIDHNVYGGGSLASVGRYKRNMSAAARGTDNYNVITYADADKGTARVTISGGTIGIDGDENGHVFGSSRGTSAGTSDILSSLAYTNNTVVTISGTAAIKGSVFGGGESGHVQTDARVTVSGGEIGLAIPADYEGNSLTAAQKEMYDLMGNVYGAGRGVDPYTDALGTHYSMSAGYVRGRTYVTVSGSPTIHRNVYGGGSMGLVGNYGPYGTSDFWLGPAGSGNGTATVLIQSSVGTAADIANHYGGNVYGSCRGKANVYTDPGHDFAEMAYVYKTDVTVDATGHTVWGNVYGGGENGHVDWGGTTVTILNGTVDGSVFGGGKGSITSPTAGIIDGPTQVNIGTEAQGSNTPDANGSYNTVVINGNVFAGNDTYSSPLGTMRVDVWYTRHTDANRFPTLHDPVEASDTAGNNLASSYALRAVYGGGNLAHVLTGVADTDAYDHNAAHVLNNDYITQRLLQTADDIPTSPIDYTPWPGGTSRKSIVHIHGCEENTVMYVYGGGKAANSLETEIVVDGGRIYQVFAGGDGSAENTRADIGRKLSDGSLMNLPGVAHHGNASVVVNGGIVHQVFGGSNTRGEVRGTSSVNFDPDDQSPCPLVNSDIFGGGNHAESNGDIEITVPCGVKLTNIYGCGNEANLTGNVTLNIEGGVMDTVFGGAKNATIDGNITVNYLGGYVKSLFGGNNVGGNITGTITVNVDLDPAYNCADGLRLDNVFGGGNNAAYTPYDPFCFSPMVNIKNNRFKKPAVARPADRAVDDPDQADSAYVELSEVYGGGYGSTAATTSYPRVLVGGFDGNRKVRVFDNIYGGGYGAPVVGNTIAVVRHTVVGRSNASTVGSVFGGGYGPTASVHGDTYVGVFGLSDIKGSVYGGGNAGTVTGSTELQIGYEEQVLPPAIQAFMDGGVLKVRLVSATPGADIYYTTDGSTPSTASTPYSSPFTITWGNNIKAIAYKDGMIPSVVAFDKAPEPTITVDANGFHLDATIGAKIWYTLDGSAPTTSGTPYGGYATDDPNYNPPAGINPTTGQVLKAMAEMRGCHNSEISYLRAEWPTITFDGDDCTITGPAGSRIIYTTDGSYPTSTMAGDELHGTRVLSNSVTINDVSNNTMIRAIVELDGYMPSNIRTVEYKEP